MGGGGGVWNECSNLLGILDTAQNVKCTFTVKIGTQDPPSDSLVFAWGGVGVGVGELKRLGRHTVFEQNNAFALVS